MIGPVARLDRAAGLAVDAAVVAHHRRRLRRIGRGAQIEPPDDGSLWAAAEPPPRKGCKVEVLVDGTERGQAPTHHLLELRGVSRRSAALLGPLQGFVVDG